MSQGTLVTVALIALFLLYITARGQLPAYIGLVL